MNIHNKQIPYAQFLRIEKGDDSVDHLQKAQYQQLLVKGSVPIVIGDLIVLRPKLEHWPSTYTEQSRNAKPLLAKVISIGQPDLWQSYNIHLVQIYLLSKETIDRIS